MNLLDNWSERGSDLSEFEAVVKELDASTHARKMKLDDLKLLSVFDADKDYVLFHTYDREQWQSKCAPKVSRLGLTAPSAFTSNMDLVNELINRSKLLINYGRNSYLTSSHLSRDLGDCARLGGDSLYNPTEERDRYLMSCFCVNGAAVRSKSMTKYLASKQDCVTVYRTKDGLAKIFSMAGGAYAYLPQSSLVDVIKYFEGELGEVDCRQWYVDHFFTQIWVEFPKKAEDIAATYKLPDIIVPGLLFETSDTRDCSYTCTATYRIGTRKCYIAGDSYSRKHIGTVNVEQIADSIKKKVYATYTRLPERLCALMTVDIDNPRETVCGILEKAGLKANSPRGVGKIYGKKILDDLCGFINPAETYTGYDIAMQILSLPEMISSDEKQYLVETLRVLCGNAIFLDFKEFDKAEPVGGGITLLPV